MNPKVNQHLRNSLALLMSEYSEQEWSARWYADLKWVIEDEYWYENTTHVAMCNDEPEVLVCKPDDKEDMLQLAIYALSHLLGGLIDFDEYWEIDL